jgi:hypothetical protein
MGVIGKFFPEQKTCSRCGSKTIDPLARQGIIEAVLNIFRVHPYHCRRCYRKFYASEPAGRHRRVAQPSNQPRIKK